MASSDSQVTDPTVAPTGGTVFDQLHAQAGGSAAPQTVFDKLHQQALQDAAAPATPVPAAASPAPTIRAGTGAEGMSHGNFADNLASSAGNLLSGIPAAAHLASGGLQSLIHAGRPAGLPTSDASDDEKNFDLVAHNAINHPIDTAKDVGNYVVDRYGSWQKAKMTAYNDPVGFMADLSSVLGGGASALKVAAKVGNFAKLSRTAEIVSGLGDTASKASQLTNPLNIPGAVVRGVAGKGMTAAAKSIYQGGLHPSLLNGADKNAAITDMGLQNRIPLNDNAPAKGAAIADAAQAQTNATIAASKAQIDPNTVAATANQVFRTPIAQSATPTRDLSQFDREIKDYLGKHTPAPSPASPHFQPSTPNGVVGPNGQPLLRQPMPPTAAVPNTPQSYPIQEAQAEKVNTYKKISSYGDQASPEQEANKGLAFGLKTAMEQFIPELAGMNEKEATAIGLTDAYNKFVAREGNSGKLMQYLKPSVASGMIAGGVGAYEHSVPMAVGAHLLTKALQDPAITSRIAIGLYRTANNPGTPYIRQIMTPAARIAEVQQHIADAKKQGDSVAPAPTTQPPTAAPAPIAPPAQPTSQLPSPAQAVADATQRAQSIAAGVAAHGSVIQQLQQQPIAAPAAQQ